MRQWMSIFALTGAAAWAPAWAQGQISDFRASATQVLAGSTVWFAVDWHIQGSEQLNGGGSPEPGPLDGFQEWLANWSTRETTTATGIDLQVGSTTHGERFSLEPGSSASGTWTFALQLDTPGMVNLTAGGTAWARQSTITHTELGSRHCYGTGSEELGPYLDCSSWSFSYNESASESDLASVLNTPSLQIEVLAVPEPATTALWLAGLVVLGRLAQRHRVNCTPPECGGAGKTKG